MIISHKFRYIFIKTRKVAGTSVEMYLNQFKEKSDVFTPIGSQHENHTPQNYKGRFDIVSELSETKMKYLKNTIQDYWSEKKYWNHMPALLVKSRIDPEIWDSYYKFTIERNPWDKIISHYYWVARMKKGEYKISEYLKDKLYPKDYDKYTDLEGNIIVDKILRYEELDDELDVVFNKLGIPYSGRLDIYAKSGYRKDKPYRTYYDEETKKIVSDLFKEEIKEFRYRF